MNCFRHFNLKKIIAPFICAAIASLLMTAPSLRAEDAATLSSLLNQLTNASASSADSVLQSLGSQLATKTEALGKSLAGNPDMQSEVTGALESLLGGKGPETVAAFQKLTAAKLTPDQLKLAKDFAHVGSAYLVQKDLSGLEGSQADVAQIVSSLRKGNLTAALPAIKKVSENVNLTQPQKDLLSSMADKFAPGAKQAGEAIGNGLKSIPGFGK